MDQGQKVIASSSEFNEDFDGLHMNPFEVDLIVKMMLKNMRHVEELKNVRLLSNQWSELAVRELSTPKVQSKLIPYQCPWADYTWNYSYRALFKEIIQFLLISQNVKIFKKFEFDGLGMSYDILSRSIIDAFSTTDYFEDHMNPLDIHQIVTTILQKVDDLKNGRIVGNEWNEYCRHNRERLQGLIKLLSRSNNVKIFKKFDFGGNEIRFDGALLLDDQAYPHIFEIMEMTKPTHVSFMTNEYDLKNVNVHHFTKFLEIISPHVVNLKLKLYITGWELKSFLLWNYLKFNIPFQFPQLKRLEIGGLCSATDKYWSMILRNCPNLVELKIEGSSDGDTPEIIIDNSIKHLLLSSSDITQNLKVLELNDTSFEGHLGPENFLDIKLKNFKVCIRERVSDTNPDSHFNFQNLNSFLKSQSETLEEFTLNLKFVTPLFIFEPEFGNSMLEPQPISNEHENEDALTIPPLYNLKVLRVKYKRFSHHRRILYGRIKINQINLTRNFPHLKTVELVYEYSVNLKWSFETDKSCETVNELILETFSNPEVVLFELAAFFPKVKYLKMKSNDSFSEFFRKKLDMRINFNSLVGWSHTLKRMDVVYRERFSKSINFQGISALSNLSHLFLCQDKKNTDRMAINPDFTPLLELNQLSKFVIKNFEISGEAIDLIMGRFPRVDATF